MRVDVPLMGVGRVDRTADVTRRIGLAYGADSASYANIVVRLHSVPVPVPASRVLPGPDQVASVGRPAVAGASWVHSGTW
jgi:hypothetical protein